MSELQPTATPPAALISATTGSHDVLLRAETTTAAPSAARAKAIARPKPGPTPETIATWSIKSFLVVEPTSHLGLFERLTPDSRPTSPRLFAVLFILLTNSLVAVGT